MGKIKINKQEPSHRRFKVTMYVEGWAGPEQVFFSKRKAVSFAMKVRFMHPDNIVEIHKYSSSLRVWEHL